MEEEKVKPPVSAFQRKLDTDPELARRCEEVFSRLREASSRYVEACRMSEHLTQEDYLTVVGQKIG
ncbi:MAG: hypothetical protein AAB821_00800 [Patescibacteria group bacterium]